jgi:putative phosphoribosyl transferase
MSDENPNAAPLPFSDRHAAGRLLGALLKRRLAGTAGPGQTIVLALPRGGVAVAYEVARMLAAPLDVLVTRKIGNPAQPELGVGAIAEGGGPVYDAVLLRRLGLQPEDLAGVAEGARAELARQVQVYRGGRPPPDVTGRHVVLVDDGLATGVTARAALRSLHANGAGRSVLAIPVAPRASAEEMLGHADDVVALATPPDFHSVGEWYTAFGQLSDEDVMALLAHTVQQP